MLQDTFTTNYKHKKFIERIVEFEIVWGLKSKDGWASAPVNVEEDTITIPFWSDKAYARQLAKEEWKDYTPTQIPLTSFLENWLTGMSDDHHLAGTNWDANLIGKESDPQQLILEIIAELKAKNKPLSLKKHSNLTELETKITKIFKGNFRLSSHMTIEQLIAAVINKHDQHINYTVYGKDNDHLITPEMNIFIDQPIQVNDLDEEIYPVTVLEQKLSQVYSRENLQDVISSALHEKKNASISELVEALNYYNNNDVFLTFNK
ncbi:hypothetical protein HDF26_001829 [Pedobacter cryoconitis]|uniref:DUF2750 domain-containing protein n=1 Tax=Pedobacter cryoconitis TaxID=188932 RepID=UPI0016182420|nr:DUF2750 domain-containing protein [Pedobacter cryoconitis]MBB6271402.1 hypothetical protein [Pedobacter cryoconitis]